MIELLITLDIAQLKSQIFLHFLYSSAKLLFLLAIMYSDFLFMFNSLKYSSIFGFDLEFLQR